MFTRPFRRVSLPILTLAALAGNQLVIDGSYPEGTGTTLALYQLTVAADGQTMSGTETWTWTSATELCHDSQSSVVANRVSP